jgi:hypothetical protein
MELRVYAEDPMNDFTKCRSFDVQLPVGEGIVSIISEQGWIFQFIMTRCLEINHL